VPLERTSGNRTEAARLLSVSFRSLRYRLSKLGITGADVGSEATDKTRRGGRLILPNVTLDHFLQPDPRRLGPALALACSCWCSRSSQGFASPGQPPS